MKAQAPPGRAASGRSEVGCGEGRKEAGQNLTKSTGALTQLQLW